MMQRNDIRRREFIQHSSALAAGMAFAPAMAQDTDIVLDFRGSLPQGVQFRRSGPATFMAADGLLRTAQENVPRFPGEDGKPLGLLIEGEASNFLTNASRPGARNWSPGSGPIAAASSETAPDGSTGVFRIQRPSPTANSVYDAVIGGAPWTEYATASVWLRSTSGIGKWRIRLRDFSTYNGVATVVEVGPSWRRYSLSFAWQHKDTGPKRFSVLDNEVLQSPTAPPPIYVLNRVNPYERVATPLTLDNVLMWGAQYELGNDASTFIPTVDATVQRKADEVTFSAAIINAAGGALTFILPQGGRRGGVILDAAGDRGGIRLAYSNSGWITARVGDFDLSGFRDVTNNRVVRLEWNKDGAQILTGDRLTALTRQAAQRRPPATVKLGSTVRLGMTQDGTRPLGRVITSLAISTVSSPIGNVALPALVPASYVQSFRDDFDDNDLTRINENATGGRPGAPAWRSRYRQTRKEVINKEKQIYMDPQFAGTAGAPLGVQPFSIQGGVLRIRADKADVARVSPHIWNYRYTSGCISSELTHWQTYGYFEMRARLPRGKGFWPAFWLLPKRNAWPPEIDVLEASGARPHGVHCGVLEKPRTAKTPAGVWVDQFIDTSDGFHTYSVDWTPNNIIFFVDGTKTFEYGAHNIHEDMYLLVNLALGSHDPNWIPDPDDTTPFPGLMEIDYVHAYRRAA